MKWLKQKLDSYLFRALSVEKTSPDSCNSDAMRFHLNLIGPSVMMFSMNLLYSSFFFEAPPPTWSKSKKATTYHVFRSFQNYSAFYNDVYGYQYTIDEEFYFTRKYRMVRFRMLMNESRLVRDRKTHRPSAARALQTHMHAAALQLQRGSTQLAPEVTDSMMQR